MSRKYLCVILIFMYITVVHYIRISTSQLFIIKPHINIYNFSGPQNFTYVDIERVRSVSINGCSQDNQTINSEDFTIVAKISELYMSEIRCRISEHVLDKLNSLSVVCIENALKGNLPEMMFYNNTSIKKLYLPRNSIIHVPAKVFQPLSNLVYLDLSRNDISRLLASPFDRNLRLEFIDMTNNSLTRIEENIFCFKGSRLKYLYLSHNYIKAIDAGAFEGCSVLTKIDLSFNLINTLTGLLDHQSIQKLDLTQNRIFNPEDAIEMMMKRKISVELKNNPIPCGCRLKDTYDRAMRFELRTDITCSSGEPWSIAMQKLKCEAETESPSEDENPDNSGTSQLDVFEITETDGNSEEMSTVTSAVVTASTSPTNDKEANNNALIWYVIALITILFSFAVILCVVRYGYKRMCKRTVKYTKGTAEKKLLSEI